MARVRTISTKMPLAISLMILVGDDKISYNKENVKRLARPFYFNNATEEQSLSATEHFSEEIYDSTGTAKICYHPNCVDFYEDILTHRHEYHFSELLKFMAHFFPEEPPLRIDTVEAVKRCYEIILANRMDALAVKYDQAYCWKIAQMFLREKNQVVQLDSMAEMYAFRKDMVQRASGTVYIAGTTLKDAFSIADDLNKKSIMDELFRNPSINEVNVFLLNYAYIGIKREDVSREIEASILNLLHYIKKPGRCPHFNIVLLSDFDIPFSLLTQEGLLTRSTHLFTKERCYRGQFLFFGHGVQEYNTLRAYFDFLLEKAYVVDLDSKKQSDYGIKRQLQSSSGSRTRLRNHVSLKKIHPAQLENIVRSSFSDNHGKNPTDYFRSIPMDQTKTVLRPYLMETERLLEKVVKDHDKSGWAKIIPSLDLGFPNNVTRIAGGFMTGALYDWSCSVPLVPVDSTVNTCTSSVFRLSSFDEDTTEEQFLLSVEQLCQKAMENGYSFSFRDGNHFLAVMKDDEDVYYLVLHSSAKQFKESCFGLYPSDNAWFKENIKVEYGNNRYLRYIRGDAAVRFVDYSNRFREYNEEIHRFVAEQFAQLHGIRLHSERPIIKHHYGMPTSSSVAIGTFVVDIEPDDPHDLLVPVFSDFGKDICIFEPSENQGRTYTLASTRDEVVLVPHGWGQVIDEIRGLQIENMRNDLRRMLTLELEDCRVRCPVTPSERLTLSQKHIRRYSDITSFFMQNAMYLPGTIKKILHPVFCYSEQSFQGNGSPKIRIVKGESIP